MTERKCVVCGREALGPSTCWRHDLGLWMCLTPLGVAFPMLWFWMFP